MTDLTDEQIVDAMLGGDTDAFAVLVSRYTARYARFAVRMLGNSEDGEEALQDAFVRAYRALGKRDRKSAFGPWFHSILSNQCRTAARRRANRLRLVVHDEGALERAAVDSPAPAGGEGSEIETAIGKLDPAQREVFLMKYVEDMSYDEIAEVTGVGVSALKMRVKRTADRLREMMGEVPHETG
ncbi:MAG: RNA polymerase sigma factor [Gemmatimonadaceae bacterium]|nr:RNA polymerase sigma factor [Gemmatimonadaceae bacterium]